MEGPETGRRCRRKNAERCSPRDVFPGTSSPKPRRSLRPSKGAGFVKESGSAAGDFRRRAVTAEGSRGWAIFARERDRREGTQALLSSSIKVA